MSEEREEAAREVEALLEGDGQRGWWELCAAIERLYALTPEAERAPLVASLRARFDAEPWRWARQAPRTWLERAAAGDDVPLGVAGLWELATRGERHARPDVLAALLTSPHGAGVEQLVLMGSEEAPREVWAALCSSDTLAALREIRAINVALGDEHVEALIEATGTVWDHLKVLNLHGSRCTAGAARALADCERAGGLETLVLGDRSGWEGRVALASSPYLSAAVRKAQNLGAIRQRKASSEADDEGAGQQFGDLRSALQQEPGSAAWCRLTHAINALSADALAQRVGPYVEAGLRSWPDAARVAPEAWIDALLQGQEHPALMLCRALELRGEHLNATRYLNKKLAANLTDSKMWSQARCLRLDMVEMANSTMAALLWAPDHPGWRALDIACMGGASAEAITRALAEAPAARLDELESLRLSDVSPLYIPNTRIGPTLSALSVPALRALKLDGYSTTSELITALLEATWLPQLRELSCGGANEPLDALRLLEHADGPRALERFALRDVALRPLDEPEGARIGAALVRHAPTLKQLDLSGFLITTGGLRALCEAAGLERLEQLTLSVGGNMGRQELAHLLHAMTLPQLRALEVGWGEQRALEEPLQLGSWAKAPLWSQLERLELRQFMAQDGALDTDAPLPPTFSFSGQWRGMGLLSALATHPELRALRVDCDEPLYPPPHLEPGCWPALEELSLSFSNSPTDTSWLDALADAAPGLRQLWLAGVGCGDKGAGALIRSGLLARLEGFGLERSQLRQPGALKLVAELERMPSLSALSLAHGSFKLKVAEALAAQPALSQLHKLDLRGNRMGFEGRQTLVSSPHLPVMLWTRLF